MAEKTNFIRDINPTKLSWSLVVGVARLYEFFNQWNDKEVFNLELVLQDEKPDLELFKHRIKENVVYSMQNFIVKINNGKTQPQYSVADEISAGIVPMQTIKEVLNMTQETSCWIVGNVVSIEVGKDGWFYTSCKTCLKKVVENKDRFLYAKICDSNEK
ncbi:hypothetical protein S83_036436, partial [Arachis hypogaea]